MKQINLLSPDVSAVATRKYVRRRRFIVLVFLSALLVTWMGVILIHMWNLDSRIEATRAAVAAANVRADRQELSRQEHRRVHALLDELESLRSPVPVSGVIALLSEVIPGDVVLNQLDIEHPPASKRTDPTKSGTPEPVVITLAGRARDVTAVPSLAKRLASQALVAEVRVEEHRVIDLGGEPTALFRISAEIPCPSPSLDDAGRVVRLD